MKGRNLKAKKIVSRLMISVILISSVFVIQQRGRVTEAREEMGRLEELIANNENAYSKVVELEKQIAARENEIVLVQGSIALQKGLGREEGPSSKANGVVLEGDVETWMDRADRLSRYLQANEQYRIPEMDSITPHDWLAVTKSGIIETEADYRIALSELRKTVKMRSFSAISEAWEAYEKESENRPLSDFRELAKYAEGKLSVDALARFQLKTDADDIGVRIITGSPVAFMEKIPVDDLWDSVGIVKRGGFGLSFARLESKEHIEAAISKFVSEMGREPVSSDELVPYVNGEESLEVLPAMFDALTTIPDL